MDYDDWGDYEEMGTMEYSYFTPYCTNCDVTFLFLEESMPGGRSSETVYCPKCKKELGNAEEDSKLLAETKSDLSLAGIDEFANSLNEKDRKKLEAKIGTPEEREAKRTAFFKALEAKRNGTEDNLSVYSPNPSEIIDEPWIYAKRLEGEYPKPNTNSGKWLVFVHIDEVDELWTKIKQATESGKLGQASKVATAMRKGDYDENKKVICVYTYDWTDEIDAFQVRQALRELGVTSPCSYKSDEDTRQGKYSATGHRVSKYWM